MITSKEQIIEYFQSGIKNSNNFNSYGDKVSYLKYAGPAFENQKEIVI